MSVDLVPPVELLFDGSRSAEEFKANGEGFVRAMLVQYGRLRRNERILDIGCGNGQKARALTEYLDSSGKYEGIDINRASVTWCQQNYLAFPNFKFHIANVYNGLYNPQGEYQDFNYRLPFEDAEFDLVFLCSVFTHIMPEGVANYIKEIGRVLKKDGRCVASFFLLNEETMKQIEAGNTAVVKFPHVVGEHRIMDLNSPWSGIALKETWVRHCFAEAGLSVGSVMLGRWAGSGCMRIGLQDAIIAAKI